MKKILIFVPLIIFTFVCGWADSYAKTPAVKKFSGRVIFVDEKSFIVKSGKTEIIFNRDEKTAVQLKYKDAAGDNTGLEICQTVRVTYRISDKLKMAVIVEVLKKSDCCK